MVCTVEVERDSLRMPDGTMVMAGSAGLPTARLALNEQRVYWAGTNSPGVYSVGLMARTTLIVVSDSATVTSISTLSPGQQIIPGWFIRASLSEPCG